MRLLSGPWATTTVASSKAAPIVPLPIDNNSNQFMFLYTFPIPLNGICCSSFSCSYLEEYIGRALLT